ncbi:NADPH2 dehydrogenase [Rhizobium petrolearium]|uniref:oxidoreductase n=1 Tax=Neorhizobium petrolearium TaxID=515361 RepID=UPI001AE9B642|nr:nitronate monooxygenase [Neorhizobium petrolearium]MBP1845710.1 NADPH2 dehydrogenase [Neorhizobium petrolearium]
MTLAFSPGRIGSLTLANRIVMPPMQRYEGTAEGFATGYHVNHYARRARGGVGLVILESTAISPEGRLMGDDIGIFSEAHALALSRIAAAVKAEGASALVQLSHGGRKSRPYGGGPLLAPSAVAYDERYGMPQAMTEADIEKLIADFRIAARRAIDSGFAGVELHAAHGYLLHQFLSPLSNRRDDEYGGDEDRRAVLPARIIRAVRDELGPQPVVTMRISASDNADSGLTPEMAARALSYLAGHGLDAVHVSAGGLVPPAAQTMPLVESLACAEIIRSALSIPVIAVGGINNLADVEAILSTGKADFVAIGRPLLIYPDLSRIL